MIYGPHHTVAALDVLALALIPVCLYGIAYIVRRCRRPAPARAALEDIPAAQLVRMPIASARKEITGS